MQLERRRGLRRYHSRRLEVSVSILYNTSSRFSLTSRRVSLDNGAECPIINLLELDDLIEREHLLL
jgi:hypothetical protein